MNVTNSSKVHRRQCKSATGLHSLKMYRYVFQVFQKCHICSRRQNWPHKVLKCRACPYWCHKTCVPKINESPVKQLPRPNNIILSDDSETKSLSKELNSSKKLLTKIIRPQQLQMRSDGVNNCMVISKRCSGEFTSYQTPPRTKSKKICELISKPSSTRQIPRSDSLSRSIVKNKNRNSRCVTAPVLFVLYRSIEDPFRLLSLFVHDTLEIYDKNVLGAMQHVRSYAVSHPVPPPRRKKIAALKAKDTSIVKHVDRKFHYDGDLDHEILLFCRSPYHTSQPLRTGIPTWDLWY